MASRRTVTGECSQPPPRGAGQRILTGHMVSGSLRAPRVPSKSPTSVPFPLLL